MAYRTTGHPSSLRQPSLSASSQSNALQQRIHEKRAELENLKQLRDLSGGLAGQMQQLEDKLSTLSNGTEAIAAVLSNWNNVLRAINMASQMMPKPKEEDDAGGPIEQSNLPQILVRIPVQQLRPASEPTDGDR